MIEFNASDAVNRRITAKDAMVHPIPVAFTEPHSLGKRWIAWRSAGDT
jgi:hypothetical protein